MSEIVTFSGISCVCVHICMCVINFWKQFQAFVSFKSDYTHTKKQQQKETICSPFKRNWCEVYGFKDWLV